ncbi:Divergent AAA domain protein [Halomonas lysinitropha]|uniref:Divergent AAA domain protein n=1 Tax=Halomonas lysinitropha TaxID=2607506 RepID=A0A5K1HY56_9GAMM|nr:RNA-binding domain-containing protein [Halomonas lysinitropha]VVZ94484.1 Divergent AAA domain protein [Halomonas lysinitropha]
MTQHTSLFEVLARHEGVDTEYKAARGGLPKSLWETYSAFANTAGGTLYLGVKEGDDGPSTAGLTEADVDKLRGEFWVTLNNPQKVSANILQEHHVSVEIYQGDAILVIEVPRATRSERPVYIGVDPFKGSYRRNHEGNFRCNEAEVQRMFADRLDQEPVDSRILEYFGFDDLDTASLKQYRNRMASRDPNHAWLTEDDLGLLTKLGGWRKDRRTQQEGLTLAGLLMFGQTQAIQDPLAVPGFHLDYRERLAEDDDIRWSDRLTIDGTWEANLFQFYQRVVQKLSHDPALKVPFRPDRRAQSDAHEALTEALVNALIHADHTGQGGIVVDRFKERFEFSNPGTLLLSQEQLMTGGVSECRSKSLQLMFQLLGVGDKAGSGLDKIRRSWHAHLWQPPSLKETLRPDRVILTLPLISVMPEDVLAQLQQRFGQAFEALSPDEAQTLVIAVLEQQVTNRRLQEMLTLHRVDITQMLSGLVEKGMLVPHGRNRGAYYTLPLAAPTILQVEASFPHKDTRSPHKDASSPHSEEHLPHSDTGKDVPIWEELERIAAPVAETRRTPPETMQATLLLLCRGRFLTLAQLSDLLRRSPKNIGERHIAPLVKAGKLQLRYPNVPNHSRQGYRTVEGVTE